MDGCEQCAHSGLGPGVIDDPLSSAAGGRWFRYCDCEAGRRAAEVDDARKQPERERRAKEETARLLAAWRAGRDAARVAALDAATRLGGADTNDGRMALCAVRAIDALPDPSPSELDALR